MVEQVKAVSALIDGDPQGFIAALRQVEVAAQAGSARISGMFSNIGNMATGVTSKLNTMVGTLTGGLITGALISAGRAAIDFGDEVTKAASRAGMAAGEMARLAVAAQQTDVDIGTVSKAFKELQTSISRAATGAQNDSAMFRALGIDLGALKSLRPEEQLGVIADRLAMIRDPADRARVGTELLGKSYLELVPLLERGSAGMRELIAEQERLGNVLSGQQIQALADADDAVKRLTSSWAGLSRTLTAAVAPALSKVFDVLSGANRFTEEGLRNSLAGARYQLDQLEKRRASIKGPKIDTSELDKDIAAAREKVDGLLGQLLPGVTPTSRRVGNIDLSKLGTGDEATPAKAGDDSTMRQLQAQLEARQLIFARENEGREYSKSQELAFWREIVETTKLGTKDRLTVFQRMSRLEVEIARETARQKIDLDQVRSEAAKDLELDEIAAAERAAQSEVETGRRTNASLLSLQKEFNEARLIVELEYLERKRALAAADPGTSPAELEKLEAEKEALRRKYGERGLEIGRQQAEAMRGPFTAIAQTINSSIGNLVNTMLTNWRNLGNALRGVLASIGQTIIHETVTKPLQASLLGWAKKRGMALAEIASDAAKGGAGAAASQASIPIVGPALAVAAMAAIFSAVSGMAGKVPSAAGGFDIPKGLNPLTQLHEREMVLPASLADRVREMTGAGDGAAASRPINVQISGRAVGGGFFLAHRDELAKAIRALGAEFKLRP